MFTRIVAGVSRADTARVAARQAVELSNAFDAELHLVSCYDPGEETAAEHAQSYLDALALHAKHGVETHVVPGDPVDAILDIARRHDADLIVVGNKGMHGAGRVLGSVPNAISHRASCSVLILATT